MRSFTFSADLWFFSQILYYKLLCDLVWERRILVISDFSAGLKLVGLCTCIALLRQYKWIHVTIHARVCQSIRNSAPPFPCWHWTKIPLAYIWEIWFQYRVALNKLIHMTLANFTLFNNACTSSRVKAGWFLLLSDLANWSVTWIQTGPGYLAIPVLKLNWTGRVKVVSIAIRLVAKYSGQIAT